MRNRILKEVKSKPEYGRWVGASGGGVVGREKYIKKEFL